MTTSPKTALSRIVAAVDVPLPDQPTGRDGMVSRRRLLQLAGGAGLTVVISACSNGTAGQTAPAPLTQPSSPTPPEPTAAADPTTDPSTPPTPAGTSAVLLCRDAWGAQPAHPGGRKHVITRMTIHHTGVVLGDNRNAPGRLRQHQHYHQDQRGWIDIAYHIGVDRNGNIFELRTPELAGDTATEYDPAGHFLVLCEGDFDQEIVTDAQLHGAALAFAWAVQNFHISADTLAGHRDVASTACPGANLYAHVASGELRHRVDDLLAAGTVNLQPVCGPEAAAMVSAIEAGN